MQRSGEGSVPAEESDALLSRGLLGLPDRADGTALDAILQHGKTTVRWGLLGAAIFALSLHGYASARAETSLFDMLHWMTSARADMKEYFWVMYTVEPPPPDPKEEPPPPPEPTVKEEEPPPPPKPDQVKPPEDIYKEPSKPAPQAAKADEIYTADGKQETFSQIQGDGPGSGFGMQSADGVGTAAVTNPHASNSGTPGGTGTDKGPAAGPPPPDHSKPATIAGGLSWNCPFPAEADAEGVDSAVATIVVTVRPDGSPASISVVSDPGSGFGRAARACALSRRYEAGLDREGNATTATTPPINVRFSR